MEDSNYLPTSEEDESLGDEDFIVPEDPLEEECFKRRLIATIRSLKNKRQQLQADQDLLNDIWTNVLAAEEYDLERPTKSYQSAGCSPNSTMRSQSLYRQRVTRLTGMTDHLVAGTERQPKTNSNRSHLALEAEKQQL